MGAAKMLWTYSSFRCSLAQPSGGQCTEGGGGGGGGGGRVRLAQAGAGCLEATSILNLILEALLIKRGSARRRIEATSWGKPSPPLPSSLPLLPSFLLSTLISAEPSLFSLHLLLAGFSTKRCEVVRLAQIKGIVRRYLHPAKPH